MFYKRIFSATFFLMLVFANAASAEEFRIESKVYADNSQAPVSESVTLFADSRVYDFLSSPREITLLDIPRNRIVLLDPARKVRTELTTDKLASFVEQLRVRASQQTEPLVKFAAEPKFEESRDDADWMIFSSPQMTYRVHTIKSNNPAVVRACREYADWTARLITMVHPGSLPPFPTLTVNAAMEREGLFADQVERTIAPSGRLGKKPSVVRSEHSLELHLSGSDRKRIQEVGEDLVTFPEISLDQYLRPVEQAKRQ
jgi:hypothetical protein